jgi:hypothetical protein
MATRRQRRAGEPLPPLEALRLAGVRCFEALRVPLDPQVTVVIGENGSGKTTIAEALASLASGDDEGLPEFPLRRGVAKGSIALYAAGLKAPVAEWFVAGKKSKRKRLPEGRLLFAYGRYRRVQSPERRVPGQLALLGPEWDEARYEPIEKDISAVVMRRKTSTLWEPDNRLLPSFNDDPLTRAAVVVIDEVDLHLHPRWQRRVVRQLTKLFPGTQFILTTHSPSVVQGAIDFGHQVVVLREREEDGVTFAHPLSKEEVRGLKGAQLGSVLVDERLFGVGSRYSAKYEATEDKVRQLRKKLEAGTATPEDQRELLKRLDRLEELAATEEERQAEGPLLSEIAKVQLASLKTLAAMNEGRGHGAT